MSMFDPRVQVDCFAWSQQRLKQQLVLTQEAHLFDATSAVVGDNSCFFMRGARPVATVDEALEVSGFPTLPQETINFMGNCFFANRLIPVADPFTTGLTWPTIIIPSQTELDFFCDTEEDRERVLETLLDWRSRVDDFASSHPCSSFGWIGAISVPHPYDPETATCICWPWIHHRYDVHRRPGDPRLFELFKVSVDRA